MDILRTRPTVLAASSSASEPVYHFNKLELAPHGWQPLVEKMAKGYVELIGEHDYCQECEGAIEGAAGHRVDCSTMVARRLLANLPLLLRRHPDAVAAVAISNAEIAAACPASEPVYHFNKLELAPQGWRPLVEKMGQGYIELIGERDYCQECGGIIEGATGHHVDCSTMVARRLLTNLPLLLRRHPKAVAAVAMSNADISNVRAIQPAPLASVARTGTDG